MKKTIILVSTRQIRLLLNFIKSHKDFRYVLLYSASENSAVKDFRLDAYFDALYEVGVEEQKNILTIYRFDDVVNIVEKELALLKKSDLQKKDLSLITQDESNTYIVAQVRDYLGLSGAGADKIINFRNKERMKALIEHAGLRVPRNTMLDNQKIVDDYQDYFKTLVSFLQLPFIMKPTESAGSDGVYKISSENDFIKFKKERFSIDEQYEAEEFIDGMLYHVDTVALGGEIHFVYACEYTWGNLEFQNGKVLGSFILPLDSSLSKKLIDFTLQCLDALGLPEGCQHSEIFINKSGELIFLESAARGPGLSSSRMYMEQFGISPAIVELSLASEVTSPIQYPYPVKQYAFWAVFPMIKGIVTALNTPLIDSIYELKWHVHVGDCLKQSSSNLDIAADLFALNDNREMLERTLRKFAILKPWQ